MAPADAVPIWRQAIGAAVTGTPSAQAGSVVMVCDGGTAKAYSSQGNLLWSFSAGGRLSPFISRSPEGTSYICRTNGNFIAINRTGRELWRRNLGAGLSAPVLTGWDGRLFISAGANIFCYTAAGSLLWSKKLEEKAAGPPSPDGRGGLLLILESGKLLEINPFGAERLRVLSSGIPLAVLPLEGEKLPGGRSLLAVFPNGALEFLDGNKGGLSSLPGAVLAATSRGDKAAAVLGNGKLVLLDSGGILSTTDTHLSLGGGASGQEIALVWDSRGIYALSRTGASAFDAEGRRLWIMRMRGAAALPAFGDDGILYAGSGDWILYAYKMEDQIVVRQSSLYGPAAEGSYGTADPFPPFLAVYPPGEAELRLTLGTIRKAAAEGRVGEREREFTVFLMEVSEGGPYPRPQADLHPPFPIMERIEALRLLGALGSRETIPFLARVFSRDANPLIKAAAAEAIGQIGVDPEGEALSAFQAVVNSPLLVRDEQVLLAVARSASSLCRFSGPPLSEQGVKILLSLAAPDKPSIVRRIAQREVDSLR